MKRSKSNMQFLLCGYDFRKALIWIASCCLVVPGLNDSTTFADEHPEYGRLLEQSEVLPALEMVAEQAKSSWERIQFWEGRCEAHFAIFFRGPSPATNEKQRTYWTQEKPSPELIERLDKIHKSTAGYWILRDKTATFTVDNVEGLYHILLDPEKEEFIDETDRFLYHRPVVGEPTHYLTSPDRSYEFGTRRKYGPLDEFPLTSERPNARMIFAKKPFAINHIEFVDVRECFSPGKFLSGSNPPYTAASRILLFADALRNQPEKVAGKVKVFITPDSPPTYTLVTGNEVNFEVSHFDGKYGFNLTRHSRFIAKELVNSRKISFREIERVFVPDGFEELVNSTKRANGTAWESKWKIMTTSINKPVPRFAFDLKKYGLRYGDRMHDQVAGEMTVYDENGEFVPLSKFAFDPILLQDAEKSQ